MNEKKKSIIELAEEFKKNINKLSKEELEKLLLSNFFQIGFYCIDEKLLKHLQSENDRLNKAVSGIYQDIKMKSLKFILNAKIDGEEREIFENIFSKYLK